MSYILDALKKSERERQQENLSPLQHLCEMSPSPAATGIMQRRGRSWLLLGGCLLLGGLVTLLTWRQWLGAVPPAEMVARPEAGGQIMPPAAGDAEPGTHRLTVQAESFDDWRHTGKDAPSEAADSARPGAAAGQRPPEAGAAAPEPAKPIRIPRDRQKIVKILPPPEPGAAGEPGTVSNVSGRPQAVPAGKPGSDLPNLQDLPAQIRADIPKLDFAGHAYALEPSQRLIVINGAIMREGDQIDGATRLVEITWEGVIIERQGVRFQVKCY